MSGWQDPDDPRQWYVLVPLLVLIAALVVAFAIAGAWTLLGIIFLAAGLSAYATWQAGKPLWPGGPRRR